MDNGYITEDQAIREGMTIDRHSYPWRAYTGPTFDPDRLVNLVTPGRGHLEIQRGDVRRAAVKIHQATDIETEVGIDDIASRFVQQLLDDGWQITRSTPRPLS